MNRLVVALLILLAALGACGGDATSGPSRTTPSPTTPPTPTPTPTPTPGAGTLTLTIFSAATVTSPANELPAEGLAVRVTDSTGAPVKGVTLNWTVTSGGGRLVATPGATDSLGRVPAAWVLGTSAAPQTLTVSHPQAPKSVTFTGYVPIGSVTASPSTTRSYIGDTVASYVVVKDTRGTTLTSPRVVIRDASIATDLGTDGLIGKGDGSTWVVVVSGPLNTPKDSVKVDFYRALKGVVWTYDDSALPSLRAYATNSGVTDSADVGANGRYTLKLTTHATGWVTEVAVDAVDRTNRRFYPALIPVALECVRAGVNCVGSDINSDVSFVLVPRQYTVKKGLYAGRTLNVDLGAAMVTSPLTGPAYLDVGGFKQASMPATGAAPKVQNTYFAVEGTWLADSFPVGVALHRACCSQRAIVADDSIQLWHALNLIQTTLGMQIWVPIPDRPEYTLENFGTPAAVNRKMIFQFDTLITGSTAGGLTFSLGSASAILAAQDFVVTGWRNSAVDHVTLTNTMSQAMLLEYNPRALGRLSAPTLVHEAMHGLGVAHGCQWASTQSYCGWVTDSLPSFEDAAYLLLAMDVKAALWKHRALHGLSAALFGQRALVDKVDPIPSPWNIPEPGRAAGPDAIPRPRPRSRP